MFNNLNFSENFKPITAGKLTARLAKSKSEIAAAQALRYQVFYNEMNAVPSSRMKNCQRDFDKFDKICDHLLVLSNEEANLPDRVVGTYRILRGNIAKQGNGFYSSKEFDLNALMKIDGEIMELGRSCVDLKHRKLPTMQLLWQAIAEYVNCFDIKVLFGCASIPGTKPEKMSLLLSYLHHNHLAPKLLRPKALPSRYVNMNSLPKAKIIVSEALKNLPPLIKGYLRLGGYIGEGAVIDEQFNSVDVSIVVETKLITKRYLRHYERSAKWSDG